MSSGASPKKPNIRQRILHFLKTRGKAVISDVAQKQVARLVKGAQASKSSPKPAPTQVR